jgi:thioredoxin 2
MIEEEGKTSMGFSVIRTCSVCGSKNRVPAQHLADTGNCGKCKAPLPPQSEPLDVDDQSFSEITQQVTVPVLTDFWASWCGPCLAAAPEVHQLAKDMAGRALVLKVNTEEHPQLASQFGVRSIPNFVVLRNGKVVAQRSGFGGRADMRRWIEQAAA